MGANKVSLYRGDTLTLAVVITDSSDEAYDLTDYTVTMIVKSQKNDTNASAVIAQKTATVSDPTSGIATFEFDTDDTDDVDEGKYWYDIVIDDGTTRKTVIVDEFLLLDGVTDPA